MFNDFNKLEDNELIPLLKKRKKVAEKAFTVVYNRYSHPVHAYCISMINDRDHAEDIFQETFCKFYHHINNGGDIKNIKALLFTIARNKCLNYYRDKKEVVSIEDMDFGFDETNNYDNNELFNLVMMALDNLEPIYKEAFILKEIDGLPYKEITELLNINLSNAKSRVARAKMKIIQMLTPYLEDLEK